MEGFDESDYCSLLRWHFEEQVVVIAQDDPGIQPDIIPYNSVFEHVSQERFLSVGLEEPTFVISASSDEICSSCYV